MARKKSDLEDYQAISPVPRGKVLLESAFNAYRQSRDKAKNTKYKTTLTRSKNIAKESIKSFSKSARKQLQNITEDFPRAEELDKVMLDLVQIDYDINDIKINLGNINWAHDNIRNIEVLHQKKLSRCGDEGEIEKIKKSFIGRASSLLKQIDKSFTFLENYRRYLKELPVLKDDYVTVAIAGFPNVGKSTLLSKLTKAKPEVNIYPFTTKGLNLGTVVKDKARLQLIDTPGTLNRPEKMNDIEKKAYIIIRHSDIIIYIFDPTLSYSLSKQKTLLEEIKKMNPEAKIITYISKTDIIPNYRENLTEEIVDTSVHSAFSLLDSIFQTKSR